MVMALWLWTTGLAATLSTVKSTFQFWMALLLGTMGVGYVAYIGDDGKWWLWWAAMVCQVLWAALWRLFSRKSAKSTIVTWIVVIIGSALIATFLPTQTAVYPWTYLIAGVGALFLIGSPANELCKAVLQRQVQSRHRIVTGSLSSHTDDNDSLKGGRIIGPLERVLLVVLGVSGGSALAVALIAAKGVIRFPEISADKKNGSKAEEFLIGSFVSWGVALWLVLVCTQIAP
ncbi:hypothetical protein FYJ24_04510 [Actinomycetaceae bacterium WB03_NA08]|uniref:Uncharacterized protein n=1 Tax=Scrofimicrobium canadense TaxID=2652290 RepID=A0A6N7W7C2_9ACTO|nr:hypothetical protein [Scrofimicrobium canadense]MSS84038.1 hypothetical protein [Scrofimicrobium canadense]